MPLPPSPSPPPPTPPPAPLPFADIAAQHAALPPLQPILDLQAAMGNGCCLRVR